MIMPIKQMESRTIKYTTIDGKQLVGILTIPPKPKAFALLTHGITVDKNEYGDFYTKMAAMFYKNQIATLRFDFRGHGESSGSSMDVSVIGEILDIKASIEQIRKFWRSKIVLVAASFAAGPAILVANQQPNQIKCMTLIAPVLDYEKTFLKPTTPWGRTSFNQKSMNKLWRKGYIFLDKTFKLSPRLIEEFYAIRPYLFLEKIDIPILVIHGNRDSMVPYDVSRELSSSNKRIRFITLKDADHGYPDYRDPDGDGPKSVANMERIFEEVVHIALQ